MSWENRAKKLDSRKNIMRKHGRSLLSANDTKPGKTKNKPPKVVYRT